MNRIIPPNDSSTNSKRRCVHSILFPQPSQHPVIVLNEISGHLSSHWWYLSEEQMSYRTKRRIPVSSNGFPFEVNSNSDEINGLKLFIEFWWNLTKLSHSLSIILMQVWRRRLAVQKWEGVMVVCSRSSFSIDSRSWPSEHQKYKEIPSYKWGRREPSRQKGDYISTYNIRITEILFTPASTLYILICICTFGVHWINYASL